MIWIRQLGLGRALFTLALALVCAGPARAAEYLRWDKERHRVDASVQTWEVTPLLQRIAATTKWQVYLQPGTKQQVPTRFRDLAEGEALRRLLGDLNFVIVPQSNAPARLYVFRTAREDATELIRAAELEAQAKAKRIEDELVVKLKAGEKIEDVAGRYGAKVTGQLDELGLYRLKFTDADSASKARESLLKDSSAASVDYNYSIPPPESPDATGATGPRLSLQPKAPADGKYIVVGLIDTAVQPQQGRLADFLLDPLSASSNAKPSADQPTHGTAMAETILNALSQVIGKDAASTVRILPVPVMGGTEGASTFDVGVGVYDAINAGAKIINLSLSGTGDSSFLHDIIKSGYDQGVRFFAAPGNDPVTTPTYPAAWPETTAVTALSAPGQIADYANRSGIATAAAPGTAMITFNDQAYIVTGTSASTAFATGVAAGLLDAKKVTLNQIGAAIQKLMPVPK